MKHTIERNPHYVNILENFQKPHYREDFTMWIRTMRGLAVHRVSPLKYSWDHRAKICYGYYIHIQYIYTAFLKFPRKTFQNISFYSEFFQKKICIWHWHTSPHVVSIVSIFPMPIMRSSSSFNIFHWFLQFFKN